MESGELVRVSYIIEQIDRRKLTVDQSITDHITGWQYGQISRLYH